MSSPALHVDHPQVDERPQQQQQQQYQVTLLANDPVVFVRRDGPEEEGNVANITPRPLPSDCRDEERAFLLAFQQSVVDHIREFRREFPYRQTIKWSMKYGEDKEHTIHVLVKPPRSMNNRSF